MLCQRPTVLFVDALIAPCPKGRRKKRFTRGWEGARGELEWIGLAGYFTVSTPRIIIA